MNSLPYPSMLHDFIGQMAQAVQWMVDTEIMVAHKNPKLSLDQARQLAKLRLKRIGPYPLELDVE